MSSDRVHWKLSRTGGTVLIGNYKKEFSSVQVNTTTQKIKVVAIDLVSITNNPRPRFYSIARYLQQAQHLE